MGRVQKTSIAQIIFRLGKTKSKKDKLKLAKEVKGDEIAEQVVYHALNPYWTYGVLPKKMLPISSIKAAKQLDSALSSEWPRLRGILNQLMSRELTGNAARETIQECKDTLPIVQRILKKDLRCGASVSTFNAAMDDKWIPVFDVALADEGFVIIDGNIVQGVPIEYPIWAEPKYDGIRTATLLAPDSTASMFSRAGKEFDNFPHIKKAIDDHAGFKGLMLDGEVFGKTFDDVTTVAHTKNGKKDDAELSYRVWDCMYMAEFEEGYCDRPLVDRQKMLTEALKGCPARIQQAPGCLIQSEEHLLQVFAEMRKAGFEGLILKPLDALYSFKRSRTWIKVKEMFTDEFKVTGFNKGKGKYSKTLGALVVRVGDVNVEVGSGFTDAQRNGIWKTRKDRLGAWCEVKYQEQTKDGSLRFPTFLRWRPDKG